MNSLKLELISYTIDFLDIQSIIQVKYLNKRIYKASPIKNNHFQIFRTFKRNNEFICIEEISKLLNYLRKHKINKLQEQKLIFAYLILNKITAKSLDFTKDNEFLLSNNKICIAFKESCKNKIFNHQLKTLISLNLLCI